jgi:4-hydroxybenzoate polyprenyltransferase
MNTAGPQHDAGTLVVAPPADRVGLLTRVRHILEMIRFSHTLFALPFALLSGVMAWNLNLTGEPAVHWRWQELLGILLCMIFARSAAMAFNRIADWQLDAENPRTSGRHIPAGKLSVGSVSVFAGCNAVAFVAATLLFWPNWLPLALSVPVLLFLLGYSLTKRFT